MDAIISGSVSLAKLETLRNNADADEYTSNEYANATCIPCSRGLLRTCTKRVFRRASAQRRIFTNKKLSVYLFTRKVRVLNLSKETFLMMTAAILEAKTFDRNYHGLIAQNSNFINTNGRETQLFNPGLRLVWTSSPFSSISRQMLLSYTRIRLYIFHSTSSSLSSSTCLFILSVPFLMMLHTVLFFMFSLTSSFVNLAIQFTFISFCNIIFQILTFFIYLQSTFHVHTQDKFAYVWLHEELSDLYISGCYWLVTAFFATQFYPLIILFNGEATIHCQR